MGEQITNQTPAPPGGVLEELRRLADRRRMQDGWVITGLVLCAVAAVGSVPMVLITTIDPAYLQRDLLLGLVWPCVGCFLLVAAGFALRQSLREKSTSLRLRAQLGREEFFHLAASDPKLASDVRFLRFLDRELARERRCGEEAQDDA